MRQRVIQRSAFIAWLVAGLTLALMFSALLLAVLSRAAEVPMELATPGRVAWLIGFAAAPIVGALIVSRRPENPYGWVWLGFSFFFGGVMEFFESYGIFGLYLRDGRIPFVDLSILLTTYGFLIGFGLLPFLVLLFPTGRLLSRRWRVVGWISAIGSLITLATAWAVPGENIMLFVDNPYAPGGIVSDLAYILFDVGVLSNFAMLILTPLSLFIRFRRAADAERQQIKWFVFAAAIWVAALIQQLFWELLGIWDNLEEAVTLALLPISVGVAILRYRLYDIDVIIRRTLVYTLMTAILALVYFATVLALQWALTGFAGVRPPVVVVLSTLLIAALFNPVRGRVQAMIDRRFYRRKYDAEHTLTSFAASARNEVELDALAAELVRVVEETMQPEHVSLWLRIDRRRPTADR